MNAMGHVRPRGRAVRAHVRRKWRTGHEHVAGGHAGPHESTRKHVWGATWQDGWQVKGPRVVGLGNSIGAVTQ